MITDLEYRQLKPTERRHIALAARFSAETVRSEQVGYREPTDAALAETFRHHLRGPTPDEYPAIRGWFFSEFAPEFAPKQPTLF